LKFSPLKHLQLFLSIFERNVDSILYSVSFLRATPFIEDLEIHVSENFIFKFVLFSSYFIYVYSSRHYQLCILLFFKFRGDVPKKLCIIIFQL
jgi:hypothetical protein